MNEAPVFQRVGTHRLQGILLAAGSGILYGSINVLAKPIDLHPLAKSAFAYLVSAAVLLPFLRGASIPRADMPRVLAMGLLGGGAAPILLFYGLRETAAADAGLLLTSEMVVTAVLGMVFLHERFRALEVVGLGLLLAAAGTISLASGGDGQSTRTGILLVLGSALAWGIDNAVSTHLVGNHKPQHLIAIKGLLGGSAAAAALGVAAAAGADLGPFRLVPALQMAGLGVLAIAVSSMLFYIALGRVGAGRTSALNVATTALIGASGGAVILGEHLNWLHGLATAFVLGGAALLAGHQASSSSSTAQPPT